MYYHNNLCYSLVFPQRFLLAGQLHQMFSYLKLYVEISSCLSEQSKSILCQSFLSGIPVFIHRDIYLQDGFRINLIVESLFG